MCNLFGYDYSPPHGKWDHPFWAVGERPRPAAGGSASSSSNVAGAPAAAGQSARSISNVAPPPQAPQNQPAQPTQAPQRKKGPEALRDPLEELRGTRDVARQPPPSPPRAAAGAPGPSPAPALSAPAANEDELGVAPLIELKVEAGTYSVQRDTATGVIAGSVEVGVQGGGAAGRVGLPLKSLHPPPQVAAGAASARDAEIARPIAAASTGVPPDESSTDSSHDESSTQASHDKGAAGGAAAGAVEEEAAKGASPGADNAETDLEEDPVEARNRYLRNIRAKSPVQRKARGNDPLYNKDFVMDISAMRTHWPVDWGRIDELNAMVPQWVEYTVTPQSLTQRYLNLKGEDVNFVQWYRDWALHCSHILYSRVDSHEWNDLRIGESLPDTSILGARLSRAAWLDRWEYYRHNNGRVVQGQERYTNYFKHLFTKHMGEVAMVKPDERYLSQSPMVSRNGHWPATFFHPQFAIKAEDRARWANRRQSAAGDFVTAAEAAKVGSTTFMDFTADGQEATFKVATVLSLPELFLWGAKRFTALELYFYYNNCLKVVKKRPHAWSSQEKRDAVHLRYRDRLKAGRQPRWGHWRHERPTQQAAAGAARPRPRQQEAAWAAQDNRDAA